MKAWSTKQDWILLFPERSLFEQTCAEAAERQCVLSKEVVAGGVVIVLHHEANESQVRTMDSEVKGTIPAWVEAWGKETPKQTC